MDTALIIIDIQNDYFSQGKSELFQSEQALTITKKLLEHFRENRLPIFYVQHISPENATLFLPNTIGVQLHNDIEPLSSENINDIINKDNSSTMSMKMKGQNLYENSTKLNEGERTFAFSAQVSR